MRQFVCKVYCYRVTWSLNCWEILRIWPSMVLAFSYLNRRYIIVVFMFELCMQWQSLYNAMNSWKNNVWASRKTALRNFPHKMISHSVKFKVTSPTTTTPYTQSFFSYLSSWPCIRYTQVTHGLDVGLFFCYWIILYAHGKHIWLTAYEPIIVVQGIHFHILYMEFQIVRSDSVCRKQHWTRCLRKKKKNLQNTWSIDSDWQPTTPLLLISP